MVERPLSDELLSEIGAMLQAGQEREVIERLHREAGKTYRQATQCIKQYRYSLIYNPPKPCPHCGELLRTNRAQQCFLCGSDWHPRLKTGDA